MVMIQCPDNSFWLLECRGVVLSGLASSAPPHSPHCLPWSTSSEIHQFHRSKPKCVTKFVSNWQSIRTRQKLSSLTHTHTQGNKTEQITSWSFTWIFQLYLLSIGFSVKTRWHQWQIRSRSFQQFKVLPCYSCIILLSVKMLTGVKKQWLPVNRL